MKKCDSLDKILLILLLRTLNRAQKNHLKKTLHKIKLLRKRAKKSPSRKNQLLKKLKRKLKREKAQPKTAQSKLLSYQRIKR